MNYGRIVKITQDALARKRVDSYFYSIFTIQLFLRVPWRPLHLCV